MATSFTNEDGVYDYWTVMPANYETIRTRHMHVKIGGENIGFESPVYTTQFYWPSPFDADIDADGVVDKIIEDGVQTNLDAISNAQDGVLSGALSSVGAADASTKYLHADKRSTGRWLFRCTTRLCDVEHFPSSRTGWRLSVARWSDWLVDDGSVSPFLCNTDSASQRPTVLSQRIVDQSVVQDTIVGNHEIDSY